MCIAYTEDGSDMMMPERSGNNLDIRYMPKVSFRYAADTLVEWWYREGSTTIRLQTFRLQTFRLLLYTSV